MGLFHDPIQALQRDLITEGRTEHAGQSQLDANIAGLLRSQLLELSHAFLNSTARIAEVVLLAGADHEGQHVGAGRDGVIGTALIKGQGAECAAFFGGVGLDRFKHGGRIGHLGHDLGIDEAGNFQLLGTAIDHTADVLDIDLFRK